VGSPRRPTGNLAAAASNRALGTSSDRADNYYLLMRAVSLHTTMTIGGDVIDELLGGYYAHREGPEAFPRLLGELGSKHLAPLETCSNAFGVDVHLPYASVPVMLACSRFHPSELVQGDERKRPIYEIARRAGVPQSIQTRRKLGLVSALNPRQAGSGGVVQPSTGV
jgi:asparagine synthetase B (glutamine-hydrolysing)